MLQLASYTAAYGLGLVALYSNLLFASGLGSTQWQTALWVAVAMCSAVWTASGLSSICRQAGAGDYKRAFGAAILLLVALVFDALAGYDLALKEISQHAETAKQDAGKRRDVERDIKGLEESLSRSAAPETGLARATLAAVSGQVTDDECRAALLPNRMRQVDAERIRDACERKAEALQGVAAAEARDRQRVDLAAARARLEALGTLKVADGRTELFRPEVIAWLPVALVLLGAVFGPWCVEGSASAPKPTPAPAAAPRPTLAGDSVDGGPVLEALRRTTATDQLPPNVEKDNAGRLVASQRVFAALCGVSLARFNRELQAAASAGLLEVDTSGQKTAIRVLARSQAA